MNHLQPHRLTRLGALVASATLALTPTLRAAEPGAPATGTIKGRLVFPGAPPAPKVAVVKGDPKVKDDVCKVADINDKDLVVDPVTKGVANGIAYLIKPSEDYKATEDAFLAKNPEVVIDQKGCEFLPFTSIVHKDQDLKFTSADPVGHNVRFTTFNNGALNQMLPPNGSTKFAIKKEERRPTPMFCDIHPWMKGYFFIVDSPFAAVTKTDGSFEIKDVPAGTQMLVVWQGVEGLQGLRQRRRQQGAEGDRQGWRDHRHRRAEDRTRQVTVLRRRSPPPWAGRRRDAVRFHRRRRGFVGHRRGATDAAAWLCDHA